MKKPNIFKPKINHNLTNNKYIYYSYKNDKEEKEYKNETPIETLDRLIRNNSYIFKQKVLITTKDKTYLTKIAGKIGKNIITLDNDRINIDDIIKIEEQ